MNASRAPSARIMSASRVRPEATLFPRGPPCPAKSGWPCGMTSAWPVEATTGICKASASALRSAAPAAHLNPPPAKITGRAASAIIALIAATSSGAGGPARAILTGPGGGGGTCAAIRSRGACRTTGPRRPLIARRIASRSMPARREGSVTITDFFEMGAKRATWSIS